MGAILNEDPVSPLHAAIAHECQHPSGTMDDPLTAALMQCQCGDDFWTRRLDPADERPEDRKPAKADDGTRLPIWFVPAAVAVVATVSAFSHFLPWGFGK